MRLSIDHNDDDNAKSMNEHNSTNVSVSIHAAMIVDEYKTHSEPANAQRQNDEQNDEIGAVIQATFRAVCVLPV